MSDDKFKKSIIRTKIKMVKLMIDEIEDLIYDLSEDRGLIKTSIEFFGSSADNVNDILTLIREATIALTDQVFD